MAVTESIRADAKRVAETDACGCRPGFRLCDEARALYAFVAEAGKEYRRLVREEPGNGPAIDAALRAHRCARAAYDAHVHADLDAHWSCERQGF